MNIPHADQPAIAAAGVSIGSALFHWLAQGSDYAATAAPYIACISGLLSIALVIKRWREERGYVDNDTEGGV